MSTQGGFRAEIRGASLWDLVQMECLARRRSCVRVTSPHDVGYLYFDRGDIVHATTKRLAGQLAALEILSWEHGSFSAVDEHAGLGAHGGLGTPGWSGPRTIELSHEALILRAAQLRDEALATVLPFPEPNQRAEGDHLTRDPHPSASAPPPFTAAVKLDSTGRVIEAKGSSGDLAPVAAYVARLAELLSENLGFPSLATVECRFQPDERGSAGGFLLRRTAQGDVMAVQSQGPAEHAALRWSLGLEGR